MFNYFIPKLEDFQDGFRYELKLPVFQEPCSTLFNQYYWQEYTYYVGMPLEDIQCYLSWGSIRARKAA